MMLLVVVVGTCWDAAVQLAGQAAISCKGLMKLLLLLLLLMVVLVVVVGI